MNSDIANKAGSSLSFENAKKKPAHNADRSETIADFMMHEWHGDHAASSSLRIGVAAFLAFAASFPTTRPMKDVACSTTT